MVLDPGNPVETEGHDGAATLDAVDSVDTGLENDCMADHTLPVVN